MRKTLKAAQSRKAPAGKIELAYCDREGNVFEYPGFEAAFRVGRRFVPVDRNDLVKLPFGSVLFSLPERYPVYYNRRKKSYIPLTSLGGGKEIWAASSFLSSGYLRTHLPAFHKKEQAPNLSLWAYAGLVFRDGEFYVPAFRVDADERSDPEIHQNDPELKRAVKRVQKRFPSNRLVGQLARCSTEYRCLCARNFFLGRYEAPVPTSPACNARCIGCLSYQSGSGFRGSQDRLGFKPAPGEIAQVILNHVERVNASVVSFGQGCEGEPLMRGKDLAKAIRMVREKTSRGTINLNTNGSLPGMVRELISAGLDSIRISLNSPTEAYYLRHFRPVNYTFDDVKRSLECALSAGIFVSINLFFLPGFTDMETEAEALFRFLKQFPIGMIQARNLNMDPDYYLDSIGFIESEPLGVKWLVSAVGAKYPDMKIGYYNPPKESFLKAKGEAAAAPKRGKSRQKG